jgi:hypothetical protein
MDLRTRRFDFEVQRAQAETKPIDQSSPRFDLLAVRNERNVQRALKPEREPLQQVVNASRWMDWQLPS